MKEGIASVHFSLIKTTQQHRLPVSGRIFLQGVTKFQTFIKPIPDVFKTDTDVIKSLPTLAFRNSIFMSK